MTIPIDVALTESELAREFLDALAARQIPEKFFYWFPLSVRAWLALCGEGAYRNFSRSHDVIARHANDVAAQLHAPALEVVSLGAGQGDKDRLLLDALAADGRDVLYRPVDASMGLLEIAVRDALAGGHRARGLKADFTDDTQLEALGAPNGRARLYLLLGNTLGGFDPSRLAGALAARLRDQDAAIVDGELFAGADTLAGYDNPLNRRFAFAPLAGAGLTEEDGYLDFSLAADAARPGLFRVGKHFTAERHARLHTAGETLSLAPGDTIAMSASHKYDESGYRALLNDAGLAARGTWRSADDRFVMSLVGRA